MKKVKFKQKLSPFFIFFIFSISVNSQQITGTVVDIEGNPVAYASVIERGTRNGVSTDDDGKFNLRVTKFPVTIVVSSVGYGTFIKRLHKPQVLSVVLSDTANLDEIIIVGSRTAPRSNSDTPLPVDVVGAKELSATGQATFDKALQYKIPSFNTVQTPVNDATSLLDPYEIRNMGPSRTLILINGKRKNLSSLLYTQTSPGRGETGADISAIPTDAIKRVEILRDGASAQYGSDAIAGVMNIILKNEVDNGSVTLRTGMTSEGDGEMFGVSVNEGSSIGETSGFVNYTVDFSKVEQANRPGKVDAFGEAADFGADISIVEEFLSRHPDAGNINGSPKTVAAKFAVNAGFVLSSKTELYANAAYVYKKVNSYANYRTPYWRTLGDFPYLADFFPGNHPSNDGGYDGYVPTFEGDLSDYNATIGFKTNRNEWNIDLSFTIGGNSQLYKVNDSHNRNFVYTPSWNPSSNQFEPISLYRENSPVSFDPGGTSFSHTVGNIDVNKVISDKISIGLGAEFRSEIFEVIEGGVASYDGGGADSFAGNTPQNSGKWNRYNLGGYFSVDYDISKSFLMSATIRGEDYSDFGSAFVYKLSSRIKLTDNVTARASVSTGFRAPTLHQIYTQKSQYSFVPGQGIQVGGLVNNISPEAALLGLKKLDAEKSNNFTIGLGGKLPGNLSFTVDYYNIAVKDRIVLGTEVTPPNTSAFEGLSDISFFANALDTKTSGVDVVLSKKNIHIGTGALGLNLSGNYTIQNKREGEVKNPDFVTANGQSIVSITQEALFFTSRPETKWIFGINYEVGKIGIDLNNTYFGKTTFKQQGMSSDLRTEFTPKILTDIGVAYGVTENMIISLNVNNLLNVLPEWSFKAENDAGKIMLSDPSLVKEQSNLITFNQRYSQMTYDGYHFSQLGTMFNLSLNYKF